MLFFPIQNVILFPIDIWIFICFDKWFVPICSVWIIHRVSPTYFSLPITNRWLQLKIAINTPEKKVLISHVHHRNISIKHVQIKTHKKSMSYQNKIVLKIIESLHKITLHMVCIYFAKIYNNQMWNLKKKYLNDNINSGNKKKMF